jgi:nitrogen fixation protein FixH
MVTLAIATNPGLVVDDYYERGREMERTIASRVAETPGWTMSIDTPADIQAGVPATVRFFVVDRAGQPVSADDVTYRAYRPSDADRDFVLPMVEEAPGRYAVELAFPIGGVWDTLVEARASDSRHVLDQRISVAQP